MLERENKTISEVDESQEDDSLSSLHNYNNAMANSSVQNENEENEHHENGMKKRMMEVVERKEILQMFTLQRDEALIPITNETLDWRYFNVDYYSHDREYSEVEDICKDHMDKLIDIRPYIIDTPYLAQSTDRLQKVVDLFRTMHLRALAVTNPATGAL